MPTELEQHEIDISTAHVVTAAAKAASNGHLAPHAVEVDDRESDFLDLLIAIVRHKRAILALTLGGAILSGIVSLLLPSRYTATTRIMPPQQTQSTASVMVGQLAGSGLGPLAAMAGKDLGLKSPNDIYIGMLKSRTVADSLIAQYDLRRVYHKKTLSRARKALEEASDVSSSKEGLINLSVEDQDPKLAAAIANSYITELRKLMQSLAVTEASQRRLFFEQQLERAKDDLATAEEKLRDTQQRTGMIQLDSQAKALIEQIGMLRAQIATKEVQLQAILSFATKDNPDYVVIQREIAALKVQLAKLESQAPAHEGDPLLPTASMPGVAMSYVRSLREVKYREAVFDLLARQFEAAKVDEAKQAALIQVLDPAVQPDDRSSPKRAFIVILCTLLSFLASLVYSIVLGIFEPIAHDRDQRSRLLILKNSLLGRRSEVCG